VKVALRGRDMQLRGTKLFLWIQGPVIPLHFGTSRLVRTDTQSEYKGKRITKCQFGEAIAYRGSVGGDVWMMTWADDDNLYAVSDETLGFDDACFSNIAIHRISGGPPPDIQGVTVNCLTEFGKSTELKADGAKWNVCGLTCVDGVLYLAVDRLAIYPESSGYWSFSEAWDSSIIKSTDHGKTWTPVAATRPSDVSGTHLRHPGLCPVWQGR